MALPDFSHLPIVVTKSPRRSVRRCYVVICTLLGGLAILAALGGDDEAIFAIPVMFGIAGVFELFGSWLNRIRGYRIEIDAERVHYQTHRQNWSEPLSSYTSVSWYEEFEVKRLAPGGTYVEHPYSVRLLNDTNPRRSLELLSAGIFSNRDKYLTAWRVVARTLDLPTSQTGGTGVDIVDLQELNEAEPVQAQDAVSVAQSPTAHFSKPSTRTASNIPPSGNEMQLEAHKAHRGVVASLPIIFFVFGAIAVFQNVARGGLEILDGYGPILFLVFVAFAAILGRIFTRYRIQITEDAVSIVSVLGKFDYNTREVDRRYLSEIIIHSSKFAASVALQSDGMPTVVIGSLSNIDAQRIKRFIEEAIHGFLP